MIGLEDRGRRRYSEKTNFGEKELGRDNVCCLRGRAVAGERFRVLHKGVGLRREIEDRSDLGGDVENENPLLYR